ncbi:MAG: CocE/NonD family hydrolase [Candidatus Aminicenantes bacterium]|nr:CocE/NonD family hydrolase [Candidatus Aminicenantes bacterium]
MKFLKHVHYKTAVFVLLTLLSAPIYLAAEMQRQVYKVTVDKGVPGAMRDGNRLFSDVYRPDAPGKFPAILIRTPYNKEDYGKYSSFPVKAVQCGYAVIIQDVRGRYSSEGDFLPYVQEIRDGYDSVEWASGLPFVNGKVAMYGCSYLGAVQWLAAVTDPPHLVAIFPQCTFANGRHFFFFGGTFDLSWIGWLYDRLPDIRRHKGMDKDRGEAENNFSTWEENKWKWLKYTPLIKLPIFDGLCPYYFDWLAHPDNGPFWDFSDIEKGHRNVSVPAYNLTGWYDDGYGQPGALLNFLGMKANGKTDKARTGQKLIIGPWTHCDWESSKAGDIDFGPDAVVDVDALALRWFDFWMKGIDNGIMKDPPIKFFVMGDNVWRAEQQWPLFRTEFTSLYLRSDSAANSLWGDGTLSVEIPVNEKTDRYIYDPSNPVTDYFFEEPGVRDLRTIEVRNDVCVYTSDPLTEDCEVTGPVTAEIYASSSAKDTDFVVKVCDVHPCGYSQNITPPLSGVIRGRYRDSESEPSLLESGRIYKFSIALMHTSHVFKKGHRIRISVTSSYFPFLDRNPNTGRPFGEDDSWVRATQTIFHGPKNPSRIILPVIPRNTSKE